MTLTIFRHLSASTELMFTHRDLLWPYIFYPYNSRNCPTSIFHANKKFNGRLFWGSMQGKFKKLPQSSQETRKVRHFNIFFRICRHDVLQIGWKDKFIVILDLFIGTHKKISCTGKILRNIGSSCSKEECLRFL